MDSTASDVAPTLGGILEDAVIEKRALELLAEAERNPAMRIKDREMALEYYRRRAIAEAARNA